jgi:UDP-N-acetyl-D-mannosaminuronic acid dehydrogenase
MKKKTITVVGGCGHIGLPLSIILCNKGYNVIAYDLNNKIFSKILKGQMPFLESGASSQLKKAINSGRLILTDKPINQMKYGDFIITIGTPVDEFLNPSTRLLKKCIDDISDYIKNKSLVMLRSTVSPGTTDWLSEYLNKKGKTIYVSFCLERVVQGKTFDEISKIPQIIAGTTREANTRSSEIFKKITRKIIITSTKEAELAKLFSNAFRYIQFAITNQFYMLADEYNVNFKNIRNAMTLSYPRAENLPSPGFAAGPCLFKDTMQLVSFAQNNFTLGFNAMLINEGLILHIIKKIEKKTNLKTKTVGLLGMAFKANIDDTRSSLSFKLKKLLKTKSKKVLCNDPYIKDDKNLVSISKILTCDIIIVCVPHKHYKKLKFPQKKIVINIWD